MKKLLAIITMAVALTACHSSDNDEPTEKAHPQRTVIIYMAAENNLSIHAWNNLLLMKEGSRQLNDNQCLLVYVDRSHETELPYLARLSQGQVTDSVSLADMNISSKDEYASDPHVFEDVLRYAVSRYPASQDCGLVLWGHSSGWMMEDSLLYTRGYGFDNGHNDLQTATGYWLNIPTMNKILKKIPAKWSFIMGDCCHFACLENVYELRHTADYIIGSAAEIPGKGAPYDKIIADFFLPTETACKNIIDKYYSHVYATSFMQKAQPLVAIKTSEMDQLATTTRYALQAVKDSLDRSHADYPDMKGIIHYLYADNHALLPHNPAYNIFYDAGDFIRHYTPSDVYTSWKLSLERAIVYRRMATEWNTQMAWDTFYNDFKITDENYHGVSMFVPQDPTAGNYAKYNQDIKKMSWYEAVGLDSLCH